MSMTNASWRTIRCKGPECGAQRIHVVHGGIVDVDSLIRRAMATYAWYPIAQHEWLCPHCGWARELRHDPRATNARELRKALFAIQYIARAA